MDNKGYYKLLGVDENATVDEIQKKFRSLALKWHPDRWVNGTEEEKKKAEQKFKEYNEAYSVLSDDQKRRAYDMGLDGDFSTSGTTEDSEDPFEAFFQSFSGGRHPFGNHGQQVSRGADIETTIDLTMEEANNGAPNKVVHYNVHKPCSHCNGTGLGKDGRVDNCPYCQGTGFITHFEQRGFMQFQTRTTCPHCHGKGKTIINPCPHCSGTGFDNVPTAETITVDIPRGVIFGGGAIKVSGAGGYPERGQGIRGDLILRINLLMPDGYSITDNAGGVEYKLNVPFYDAFLGCEKEVLMPSGKKLKVRLNENTANGDERIYHGEGMKLPNGTSPSDFKVTINFTSGTNKLTKEQKDLLQKFKKTVEK